MRANLEKGAGGLQSLGTQVFALLAFFGFVHAAGTIVNFDTAPLGKTPPGWVIPLGSQASGWEVVRDQTAPTQPHVFAHVPGNPHTTPPVAILEGLTARDLDVSVRLKPVAGHENQAGGVVFRYRNDDNYYLARANAAQQNVALYKIEKGRFTGIGLPVKHDLPPNAWKILKVSVRGSRIQIYMNHRRVLTAADRTFMSSGGVGLWTAGDSVTYFDDFRVYPK